MKKVLSMCMVALTAIAMMTGCGSAESEPQEQKTQEQPTMSTGKLVINFEGSVAYVNENGIVLDNGQVVSFDENTTFTDVNGAVEDLELTEGDYIQGYTADDAAAAEITAKRVHIVVY